MRGQARQVGRRREERPRQRVHVVRAVGRVRPGQRPQVVVAQQVLVVLEQRREVQAARQRVATATEAWKAASDNVVIFASNTCNIDLGKTG